MSSLTTSCPARRLALIMGVANHRSIAWGCVQSFLEANFDCIVTFQSERFRTVVQSLVQQANTQKSDHEESQKQVRGKVLAAFAVDVETDLSDLFHQQIPALIQSSSSVRKLDAIVHSIAYADFERHQTSIVDKTGVERLALYRASSSAFLKAHAISAYSLLETAREAVSSSTLQPHSSLTALTYLGAVRAVPNYHIMGPAKASLEAIVRGLALDLGDYAINNDQTNANRNTEVNNMSPELPQFRGSLRVNAVSAGPLPTLAARGIPQFARLYKNAGKQTALQRPITVKEVADTVRFLATDGTGITGQTIYVDGGYSSIGVQYPFEECL